MKKEDYIKQLHEDELYKLVVSKASTETEKRAIQAFTEEFMLNFVDVLEHLRAGIEENPEVFRKTLSELESEPLLTGSVEY
jgi:hypothetical protein